MKSRLVLFTGILVVVVVLFTGCGDKQRTQEAIKLAQEYLDTLKVQVSDETIYLTDDEVEHYGEMISFIACSEKYGGDFRINVNTDDSVSDTYFALSLEDTAVQEFAELVESVFPGNLYPNGIPEFELSINSVTGLSGMTFESVREAHEALNNAIGLINVVITPSDSDGISDEVLDGLLNSMQAEAFYGDLSIADDTRVFHISETEINYTRTDDGPGEVRYYDWVPGQNE